MSTAIRYTITPARPEAHLYRVTCAVEDPDPSGQRLALLAWIPGSYMIREFARHVVSIRAASRGKPISLAKIDKHTWRAAPAPAAATPGRLAALDARAAFAGAALDARSKDGIASGRISLPEAMLDRAMVSGNTKPYG